MKWHSANCDTCQPNARTALDSNMQTQAIVAEQTSRTTYGRPSHFPSREIELTVRLEIPEATGADVGIDSSFEPRLSHIWEDALHQRIYRGVHNGLANVEAQLPEHGIGVRITKLQISPLPHVNSVSDDIQRLGDALEALTESIVAALWAGILSFGTTSAP